MNVVSFFYITSSVTKGTLHLNDLSEWVQPRLVKAPSQYNEHLSLLLYARMALRVFPFHVAFELHTSEICLL